MPGGDERARGGEALRGLAREREEDAAVFRAAGVSAHGAGPSPEARRVHRAHRAVAEGEDHTQPRKQRHTAKRVFYRLRTEYGFVGSYTIVKDYVREHRRRRRELFVPPGADGLFAERVRRPAEIAARRGEKTGAGNAGGRAHSIRRLRERLAPTRCVPDSSSTLGPPRRASASTS